MRFFLFFLLFSPPIAATSSPRLIILVDAPHLNYSSPSTLLQTLTKHPATGCKDSSFGHAWLILIHHTPKGQLLLECGHSGEHTPPTYFETFAQALENNNPNPFAIFYQDRSDGFCQQGNGGHRPTLAAQFTLSEQQLKNILSFLKEEKYNFHRYNVINHHCCSFVREVASQANIDLSSPSPLRLPNHSLLIETPDTLEQCLYHHITNGTANNVSHGYWRCRRSSPTWQRLITTITLFPKRYHRHLLFVRTNPPKPLGGTNPPEPPSAGGPIPPNPPSASGGPVPRTPVGR